MARRVADGQLVGITHFLVHPSSSEPDLCYLEDLFTDPAVRGRGVADRAHRRRPGVGPRAGLRQRLLADPRGNAVARRLYDEVATYEATSSTPLPVEDGAGDASADGGNVGAR